MNPFIIDIPVPSMGATVSELTLIDLFIGSGATVAKGDRLAEFESDKSVFDFEAPCAGEVKKVFCRAGDILASGAPFLRIETNDQSLKHLAVPDGSEAPAETSATGATESLLATVGLSAGGNGNKGHRPPAARAPRAAGVASPQTSPAWTPRAAKLARENGLEPDSLPDIAATGPGGRVSGDDVLAYLSNGGPGQRLEGAESAEQPVGPGADQTVCVAGIGYAVPRNIRSNQDILKAFPDMTEEEIIRITGIKQRYYADENESATSLSQTAVEHALGQAGIKAGDIDGVIVATIIPDQPVPSAASALARALGIDKALAFDINAACSGWLYALEVGRTLINGGSARNLLVVTAELLSRITNPKDHATAFLFGDGAGAAILTAGEGGHRLHRMQLSGDAKYFDAIQRSGGGARTPLPDATNLDLFYLSMNGPVVFKQAVIAFSDIIEETLKRQKMSAGDVSWIVPHQANERILRAVSKRVGIPYEKFVVTIGKYGNTSAASVSMALGWASEEEIFCAGDRIIFCSVGAGFTFAGGLLVW